MMRQLNGTTSESVVFHVQPIGTKKKTDRFFDL
jgi:hypothetical protein